MDQFPIVSACFILSYFLGSIPTAVWTGKLMFGVDVRTMGSGNAGATNTFRVLGKKAGIFVLFFDILKGYLASILAVYVFNTGTIAIDNLLFYKMIFGLTAVFGHVFPIFARFKGGKGVATLFGMVIAISFLVAGICILSFMAFFVWLHFVSVGSMVGGLVFSILIFAGLGGEANTPAKILALLMTFMLIFTHRGNIRKLRTGTENKMYFRKKAKT